MFIIQCYFSSRSCASLLSAHGALVSMHFAHLAHQFHALPDSSCTIGGYTRSVAVDLSRVNTAILVAIFLPVLTAAGADVVLDTGGASDVHCLLHCFCFDEVEATEPAF